MAVVCFMNGVAYLNMDFVLDPAQHEKNRSLRFLEKFAAAIRIDGNFHSLIFAALTNSSGVQTEQTSSPANCANKTYWIRCEVFSISANTFSGAVKYYDAKKNQK